MAEEKRDILADLLDRIDGQPDDGEPVEISGFDGFASDGAVPREYPKMDDDDAEGK